MPATGHADTTMSYAEVYDDGGPTGAYSSTCNATYTFHTVSPTGRYRIDVNSNLTHPQGNAKLVIHNGESTDGYTIAVFPGMGSGPYYSSSNSVTISFTSDDDYPTSGFEIILCEFNNYIPTNIQIGFDDSTTMYMRWSEEYSDIIWIMDYAFVDSSVSTSMFFLDSANFTTMLVDTNYLLFTDVPVGFYIIYRIYSFDTSSCMRIAMGQGSPWTRPVACPCVLPDNLTMTELPDSIRITWTPVDTVESWRIVSSALGMDTILPGTQGEITVPWDYSCFSSAVYINGNCTTFCDVSSVFLPAGGCRQNVMFINRVSTTGSSVEIQWNPVSDTTSLYLLYYRKASEPYSSNVLVDTLPQSVYSYTVTGLDPYTRYVFTIAVLCGGTELSCEERSTTIATTLDNCIDYIDLLDVVNIHRTWGTYEYPTLYTYGNANRHVAILDTTQFDANTGYLLRCIPPGEGTSLRLGDDNVGAEAETITFDYDVDSLDKDMLVLKFAIVMQNPNHTAANQPHFSMEILDENGTVIDTNCCYADFSAAGDLGWNAVPNSNIIWKDWTTVGIDIARYHGQRIKIRFTTKDCADGGHYGYAYLTVKCDSKRIALVNMCDSHDSVRLRAPEGFEYQWTRGDDTTVFSTVNEIMVPADSTEYRCHASFVGKPDCSFTIKSTAVLPVPVAQMEDYIDTCGRRVVCISNSYLDIDSNFRSYVRQVIDSVRWVMWNADLPNAVGDTVYGDTAFIALPDNGTYIVRLSCKLSNSNCLAETFDTVRVSFIRHVHIAGDTSACFGDTVTLSAAVSPVNDVQLQWNADSTVCFSDTTMSDTCRWYACIPESNNGATPSYGISLYSATPFGCTDTTWHHVAIHNVYDDTVYASICDNMTFDSLDFQIDTSQVPDSLLAVPHSVYSVSHYSLSSHACDSLITLRLTIHPTYNDTIVALHCDSSYYHYGFEVDSTGFYTNNYLSEFGCDSIRNLAFTRFPVFRDSISEELYYGFAYTSHGFNEDETGYYEMVYLDTNGCDSIYYLDLNVVYLQFPNAVTPNGDGVNELLEIVGLLESHIFYYTDLCVYDRWGRLVYHKENIKSRDDFWDPNATQSPDGTYFYRFLGRSPMKVIDHKSAVEVLR